MSRVHSFVSISTGVLVDQQVRNHPFQSQSGDENADSFPDTCFVFVNSSFDFLGQFALFLLQTCRVEAGICLFGFLVDKEWKRFSSPKQKVDSCLCLCTLDWCSRATGRLWQRMTCGSCTRGMCHGSMCLALKKLGTTNWTRPTGTESHPESHFFWLFMACWWICLFCKSTSPKRFELRIIYAWLTDQKHVQNFMHCISVFNGFSRLPGLKTNPTRKVCTAEMCLQWAMKTPDSWTRTFMWVVFCLFILFLCQLYSIGSLIKSLKNPFNVRLNIEPTHMKIWDKYWSWQ